MRRVLTSADDQRKLIAVENGDGDGDGDGEGGTRQSLELEAIASEYQELLSQQMEEQKRYFRRRIERQQHDLQEGLRMRNEELAKLQDLIKRMHDVLKMEMGWRWKWDGDEVTFGYNYNYNYAFE